MARDCVFNFKTLISIQNGETYKTIIYANLTDYHIEPNNNVIEESQPRLIEWKKGVQKGPNGIQVYPFL